MSTDFLPISTRAYDVTESSDTAASLPKGVIILGAAKSGTTALFYAIQNTLSKRHGITVTGLFEPVEADRIGAYLDNGRDSIPLIKMLIAPFLRKDLASFLRKKYKAFDGACKKIIIYRDPRDNVISRLVFMLPKLIKLSEQKKIDEIVELFRRKEQAPDSLSVVHIIKEVGRISGNENLLENVRDNALLPAKMKRESGSEYYMLSYEHFVEGQFDGLNRYLGFDVDPNFEVGERHSYVTRTKSSGSWKDWFLQEDIDYFVKAVPSDYRDLGFDVGQQANAQKQIDPKTSSEYALSQFARLRERQQQRANSRHAAAAASVANSRPGGAGESVLASDDAEKEARRQRKKARRLKAGGKEGARRSKLDPLTEMGKNDSAEPLSPAGPSEAAVEPEREARRLRKRARKESSQESASRNV